MGFELKELSAEVSEEVTIFPYKDISEEEWGTYINKENKRVPIDKRWRKVGFVYPYPTTGRLRKLRTMQSSWNEKGGIVLGDPMKTAKYVSHNLIKKVVVEEAGGETKGYAMDEGHKEWLYGELRKSEFLFAGSFSQYLNEGKVLEEEEEEEESVFLRCSGDTTASEKQGLSSTLREKNGDTR